MKLAFQILTISFFLFSAQYSFGQVTTSNEKNKKPYVVWIKPIDNTRTFKGYLSEVGDTLVIAPLMVNKPIKKIRLDNVNYFEFREKGKVGKSLLIGGLAGFGFGAILGYATYSPSCPSSSGTFCIEVPRELTALAVGVVGIIPGVLIGGAIGSQRIKVPIRGSKKSIQAQKEELGKYKFGG